MAAYLAKSFMNKRICRALGLQTQALADFLRSIAQDGLSCVVLENGKVVSIASMDEEKQREIVSKGGNSSDINQKVAVALPGWIRKTARNR